VYDLVKKTTHRRTPEAPLRIPEGAVVVPGTRRLEGPFPERHGLSLSTPVIVKYRDEKTDAATALEESLRSAATAVSVPSPQVRRVVELPVPVEKHRAGVNALLQSIEQVQVRYETVVVVDVRAAVGGDDGLEPEQASGVGGGDFLPERADAGREVATVD